jgi:periplasmic protein TonB
MHAMKLTFTRSLTLSLSIHILVCGGALAFAQYGNILGSRSDMIMVSLVGSGPIAPAREQDEEKGSQKKAPKPTASQKGLQESETQVVTAVQSAPAAIKKSASAADHLTGDAQKDKPDTTPAIQGIGGEAGSRAGIVTPDQWQMIQAALERAKTYPRMARERGIEGVVYVRFRVLPSGDVERAEIIKSSGSEILDSASIKTVYRARPLPRVNGWIDVPISYVIVK